MSTKDLSVSLAKSLREILPLFVRQNDKSIRSFTLLSSFYHSLLFVLLLCEVIVHTSTIARKNEENAFFDEKCPIF